MNDKRRHNGRTNKHVLITTAAVLLALPLVVFVVQQQQELRQHASNAKFVILPPGSQLPTDEECNYRVRRASWEPRPENEPANTRNVYTEGYRLNGSQLAQFGTEYEGKVTGNFTGTTDEIIQWAACKWGFDEDTVRAQAAVESSWHQSLLGNCRGGQVQPETNSCHSVGVMQVTAANIPPSHPGTWPYARISTAFNIDYTLAIRRACFDGKLNIPGVGYQAGDEWGCIGMWNTGAWHNIKAEAYIAKVKKAVANNIWNTYGAGPLPTIPVISGASPYLSLAPYETPSPAPDPYTTPSAAPTSPYNYPSAAPTTPYSNPTVAPTTPYAYPSTAPTSPYMTPPFFCLAAPCPVTPDPEPSVTYAPSPAPTASEEYPTTVISAAPTEDPCDTTGASLAHDKKKKKHSKHKNHDKEGGISKFMEGFMKFILELLDMLLRLYTNKPGPTPSPSPQQTPPVEPTDSEDPGITEEPEPSEPDPCAPEPTTEQPEPSEAEPSQPAVSEEPEPSEAQPSQPAATVPVSPIVSVNPSEALPSGSVSPSAGVTISAAPTEDPCASTVSLAAQRPHKDKSKHKHHDGFISKFFKFILEVFTVILKYIGQNPGPQPSPTPPAPTVWPVATPTAELPEPSDPAVEPSDEPTSQPQQTTTPEPTEGAEPTVDPCLSPAVSPSQTVSVAPSIAPSPVLAVSGNITVDSTYFQSVVVEIRNFDTKLPVKTQTFSVTQAGQTISYNITKLNAATTYLIGLSACHTENNVTTCSKPYEITSCSGTIDQATEACKVVGSGSANFSVLEAAVAASKANKRR